MKNFLTSLLFLVGMATGLGAEPKASAQSLYDQFLYEQLPYGSTENLISFQRNQSRCIIAKVFDPSDVVKYIDSDIYTLNELGSETLEQLALRIFNLELDKRTNIVDGKSLEVKYYFMSPDGTAQFFGDMLFIPEKESDGTFRVPSSIIDSLDMRLVGRNIIDLWWPYIKRATLVVLDNDSNLLYKGDTLGENHNNEFSVWTGDSLRIPQRFLTNNTYQVTLTVALETGVSAMYVNGNYEGYPQGRNPMIGLSMINHKPTVSVHGGDPFQAIKLLRFSSLSHPPKEETLTLDCVGSASWTDNTPSSVSFYKLTYGEQ